MQVRRYLSTRIGAAVAFTALIAIGMVSPISAADQCQPTGVDDLEAHYINEVPDEVLEVTCDIGIFFDEDGDINGVEIKGTVDGSKNPQHGIYVNGANVKITGSIVDVEEDYPDQFISIKYSNGATGIVRDNRLSGAHRVAILLRDTDTSVNVRGNVIRGTAAKTSGWAENGIQIHEGATSVVRDNQISDHYWAANNWNSSGILVFDTRNVVIQRNTITGGDLGLWLEGENHNAIHNTIETSSGDDVTVWNDGVYIDGKNIGLRHNKISALRDDNGDIGVWVFGENNKLIGNDIVGFGDEPIWNGGENTKLPKPFVPSP
jgi:nitrous oxidase accessory protein NosD